MYQDARIDNPQTLDALDGQIWTNNALALRRCTRGTHGGCTEGMIEAGGVFSRICLNFFIGGCVREVSVRADDISIPSRGRQHTLCCLDRLTHDIDIERRREDSRIDEWEVPWRGGCESQVAP